MGFFLFFAESMVNMGLLLGSGIAKEGGWRSQHIWMLEPLMSAAGRLEVRRALAMLQLFLFMVIWAALETSGG